MYKRRISSAVVFLTARNGVNVPRKIAKNSLREAVCDACYFFVSAGCYCYNFHKSFTVNALRSIPPREGPQFVKFFSESSVRPYNKTGGFVWLNYCS
jgi:hypothetical protein